MNEYGFVCVEDVKCAQLMSEDGTLLFVTISRKKKLHDGPTLKVAISVIVRVEDNS